MRLPLPAAGRRENSISADQDTFEPLFQNLESLDPLEFIDTEPYKKRLQEAKEKTGRDEAVITVSAN